MSRSRSDMPAGWTATPAFHPEFGLLSPYARKRRGVPLPVLLIAAGIAASAMIGFASERRGDGEARTTVEQIQAPAANTPEICTTAMGDDTEAAFRSSICGGGRLHAKHGGHPRFPTVVLGRTALPPEHVAKAPIAPEASAGVENEKSEKALGRAAAAKKSNAKSRMLAARERELERQNAFDAYASARRPPYAPRSMSPPWGYSTPFGPSW